VVACATKMMLMRDGLVTSVTLVVDSCSSVSDGPSRWSSPAVKSELRSRLLWQRCPVVGGPVVMVFFGASLAYLLFEAHHQNQS
jgi:hypothetical protein